MSASGEAVQSGAGANLFERIGLPRPLLWGFVAVFFFMVGDGVESNYLAPYIANHGFNAQIAGTVISIYGVAVAVGSWFSGTLSTIWGPKRVMQLGAAIWVVFEVLFLTVALPSQSFFLVAVFYGIRGFGYPFFAYGFLVWIQATVREEIRASAAGWFWICFALGLPTLGTAIAAISIGPIGAYNTFWVSLALVVIGGAIGSFAVREAHGTRPIVDESNPEAAANPTSYKRLFEGVDIIWRKPRIAVAGIVRIINTTPQLGLFVFFPFVFTREVGFSQGQYLTVIFLAFVVNSIASLGWGIVGDRFGWWRTTFYIGGIGCAITILLFYFVPVIVGPVFWVAVLVGCLYGLTLGGYTNLTAIAPAMAGPGDKGNAMAMYTFGAGLAAFVGPGIFAALNPFIGAAGVVIVYSALYVVSAILTRVFLKAETDPAERRKMAPAIPRIESTGRGA